MMGAVESASGVRMRGSELVVYPSILFVYLAVFSIISLELQFVSVGSNGGVIALAFALVVIVLSRINRDFKLQVPKLRLWFSDYVFLLLIGFSFLSSFWSVAPAATLLGVVSQLMLFFLVFTFVRCSIEQIVEVTIKCGVMVFLVSIVLLVFSPSLAFQNSSSSDVLELRGIFKHQLRFGAFMAIALGLFCIAWLNEDIDRLVSRSRLICGLVFICLAVGVYLSNARLYGLFGLIAFMSVVFLGRGASRRWFALVCFFLFVLFAVFTFQTILGWLEVVGFDTSLTGRTLIWLRTSLAITSDSFWLGYGFGTFDQPVFDGLFPGLYRPSHAHSSFLQAFFEMGLVGFSVLLLLVFCHLRLAWRIALRVRSYSYSMFLVMLCVLGSLTGLNYAGALSVLVCLTFLFLAIEGRDLKI